jgi:methionine synthase II (cobalamin-independent)
MITGIGSFPFTDVNDAISLIFDTCPEIPFWPQLPKRAPYENMYIPFLEGVPCVVVNESEGTAFMDTEKADGIETFYENVQNGNLESFCISEKVAPGFYRFLDRLKEVTSSVKFIKTQITGPFSMGLGLKDENGKPVIYNFGYFDIIKKALHMKAQWMVTTIKAMYPDKKIIIFFDEPYMVSFGSAYVSISKEEAIDLFNDVLGGIPAIRGIHCCGNTDWSVLFNADVDIINYDAFNYLETIFYFEEDLKSYISRGGRIAPGLVPSGPEDIREVLGNCPDLTDIQISGTKPADLQHRTERFRELMTAKISPDGLKDLIITPSCGLGSVSQEEAIYAMGLLRTFRL